MRVGIDFGLEHHEFEVPEDRLVGTQRHPAAPPLPDPAAAVRNALESPLGFPALRRALTPDDRLVVVVDERLPHLPELLSAIFEHVLQAGVLPRAITFLCPPSLCARTWREQLSPALREMQVEDHDPSNRQKLSYLATTRRGRRIYLNRTAVDADQLIVLSRRGYDPLLGYSGSEGSLFPALSDEATRRKMAAELTTAAPGGEPWPSRLEAGEVAWLLGAPFMVQVIEGAGDDLTHVIGGLADSSPEGERLLDNRWRVTVDEPADTVVAAVSGNPAQQGFADLAQALAAATRVVKPEGRVVLLSRANPPLGRGAELLRQADEPGEALDLLRHEVPPDLPAAFQWASAAQRGQVCLLSELPPDIVEELFCTPLDHAGQVQRLLDRQGSYLFLPDAHKTMAVLEEK
jgi:nickel-dependent lactate racemase